MPIHLGTIDEINVMLGAAECVLSQLKDLGRTPSLITLARSPYYTPVHHLKYIECETLELIVRLWPDMRDIFHEDNLQPKYAGCDLGYLPSVITVNHCYYSSSFYSSFYSSLFFFLFFF